MSPVSQRNTSPFLKLRRRYGLDFVEFVFAYGPDDFGGRFLPGFAERFGLRFAPRFGNGLGEVGKQQREQQHRRNDDVVAQTTLRRIARQGNVHRNQHHDDRADFDGKHDRIFE